MIKVFLSELQKQGWTQKQIADKVGIGQNMISKFLQGKTCTVETLVKIARAFDVSTDTVLGLAGPEPEKPRSNSMAENVRLSPGREL